MLTFPIEEIYRRVTRFDVVDEDKGTTIGSGFGFFYLYNDEVFLATKRSYIAIDEKAFLPDSIILHVSTDSNPDIIKTSLPLYDKTEKPVWQVLLSEPEEILISIPIPKTVPLFDYTRCFLSLYRFPSLVYLQVYDIALNIPISTCVSLAEYFFYSNSQNGKTLQKRIEKQGDFRINRRGFATDMVEMVLVLLQHNLEKIKESEEMKNKSKEIQAEISDYLTIHANLINELEKIMIQFSDVLEPSITDRIQKIFNTLKDGNLEDYLIAKHLIQKVLMSLGQNILFTQ